MNFQTAVFELKALRSKLMHATYQAVFAPDMQQRATATTEALAIQQAIDALVEKVWQPYYRLYAQTRLSI